MKIRANLATIAVLATFWAGPSAAEGVVELTAPDASKDLLELLQNSSLTEQADAVSEPTALDLFAASRADYDRLLGIMYDQGYYSTVISIRIDGKEAADIQPMDAPNKISKINITVISGPRFHFGRMAIGPLAPKTVVPAGYAEGRIAHSSLILDAARAGVLAWKDAGHAKARVGDQRIVANHRDDLVSSDIRLAPGPEVRFGDLETSGNKRLRTERLVEIAGFPTDKKFSPERVEQVRERLRRTGMFSSITLTEDKELHSGNILDYDLAVVEDKPRRIGGGAEYGSSEGLSLSGYWLHRDLLGGGERLRVDAAIKGLGGSSDSGSTDYTIGARLDRPATFSPDTSAYFIVRGAKETFEDYTEWGGQFGGGLTHRFNDRLTGESGIGYVWSRVSDDFGDTVFRQIALPNSLTWDNRNSLTDTTQGYFGLLRLTPFYGLGESTGSGMQLVGDVRAYHSVMEKDRLVLAGRAQIGAVYGSGLGRTPRSYLFYSGGGGTVRGQPYQSLGVNELYDGKLKTGGTRFLGFSGEARVGVTESIGVVAFYDTGFVSANEFFGKGGAWQAGAGIGLRYKTPIGPIRLDVAAPVSGDTGDGVQLYLGIGQAF